MKEEEGKGRAAMSCCTLCVHFPHGLPSLLPDLVGALFLHRRRVRVRSRTPRLHPFMRITQIRLEFVTSAVLCAASSSALQARAFAGEAFGACAHSAGLRLLMSVPQGLFFPLVFPPLPCLCHVAILLLLLLLHPFSFLLCSRCCELADPERIKEHGPGDDISEIMSCFTRVPSPHTPPAAPLAEVFTNAVPSPVTRHRVASR